MNIIQSNINRARILSLDVAVGGAALSIAISKFFNISMPLSVPGCLGISIWLIYTCDHLIDAFKNKKPPTIERHLFHRKHYKAIIASGIIVSFIGLFLVFTLPSITFAYGIGMLLLVSLYFNLIYFFKGFYLKEIFVATVYSCGIFLGPVSLSENIPLDFFNLLFLQTFLLALTNLILFSYIEYDQDAIDENPSIVLKIGLNRTKHTLNVLFLLLLVVQSYSLFRIGLSSHNFIFQILFIMMTLVLLAIQIWLPYFKVSDRYRIVGDGIFFIPALWLL